MSDRAGACDGKTRYPSPAAAHRVLKARRSGKHRGGDHAMLAAYKCGHCGHWHVGRKSFRSRDRR